MKPEEILRIVDAIHRDKNIDKEIVFQAIESALVTALTRQYGEESVISILIDRADGKLTGSRDGAEIDTQELSGRIGAQTAKQVIIQKIREAERDSIHDEFEEQIGQMVSGVVARFEGSTATVTLGPNEAILPRSEQIPGETYHPNERIRATIFEVRKVGSRVKIILSRIRPQLVQRLFEQEIPEIADGVIEIRAISREPGYRSKVAVISSDARVDCVGACVGVRGNRIKNIVEELGGERIDIVRWSDDLQLLVPNALQPAEVDEVILCQMLGRGIVLVKEDQLSLAIGRRGQNVRLASKLCGWDIEIMTREELDQQIERAVTGFSSIEGLSDATAERLVGEGFLSYDDLSIIEPDDLMEMGGITAETVEKIVNEAEKRAAVAEVVAADARRVQREHDRVEKATADADAADRVAAEHESATQAAVLGDGSSVAAQDEESLLAEESQSLAGTIPATSGKSGSMASGEPIVPSSSSVLGSNS
ncbi:MAG: transcription termination factor NusA [Planctomycetota bacterium]|jgi:N utilization substance protein A|nr:MAG: transcription termination factor NusA [Planctomycetota bacterium]